jgi:hypothetical protein
MASKNNSSPRKNPFRVTGKLFNKDKKRKKSEEICEGRKKERIDNSDSVSDIDDQLDRASTSTGTTSDRPTQTSDSDKMASDDFTKNLINALSNVEVKNLLSDACTDKLTTRIDNLEVSTKDTVKSMTTMKNDIDDLQQDKRRKNIIVSGVKKNKTSKQDIAKAIQDTLKCDMTTNDIDYCFRISKPEQQTTRVKVVFKDIDKKLEIVKHKKNLKNAQSDIWFSDDLTPHRSNLAYMARQAVKDGKAYKTWTYDSQVFVQINEIDKPVKVRSAEDIPA